jgi:hypothetical protein
MRAAQSVSLELTLVRDRVEALVGRPLPRLWSSVPTAPGIP